MTACPRAVLLYLDGMDRDPPEDDRASSVGSQVLRSPRPKSKGASSVRQLEDIADPDGGEDIRSDVQEHPSELGRTIPIHTTGVVSLPCAASRLHVEESTHFPPQPEHEPGPDDPPGPKFESYGSSFGNFGPLPRESFNGRNGVVSS